MFLRDCVSAIRNLGRMRGGAPSPTAGIVAPVLSLNSVGAPILIDRRVRFGKVFESKETHVLERKCC